MEGLMPARRKLTMRYLRRILRLHHEGTPTRDNASSSGFRIRSEYGVTVGRFLSVDVRDFAQYAGWVAWAFSGEFGFEVANPIPQAVIDHIVAMAGDGEPL
jgi:hypothetical protein